MSIPEQRGLLLKDIIESGAVDREKSYCIDANYFKGGSLNNYLKKGRRQNNLSPEKIINVNPSVHSITGWVYGQDGKSPTLTTNKGEGSKVAFHQSEKRLMVREKSLCLTKGLAKENVKSMLKRGKFGFTDEEAELAKKSKTIRVGGLTSPPNSRQNWATFHDGITYRKLTVIECERLQTMRDNYTQFGLFPDGQIKEISKTQRYKMTGNGWCEEVIVHIFKAMPCNQ